MSFSVAGLFLIVTVYLLVLFGIAYASEREIIPRRIAQHPWVHTLSFGAYASIWTFYGAFTTIETDGLQFLSSYLGGSAAFLLAPVLFIPIFHITNRYKLSSLADLFAFRFRSGFVGTLTTCVLFLATLPLISIQIQAIADVLHQLNNEFSTLEIATAFCLLIALFALLFGARHPSMRSRNRGLVMAIAANSVFKLGALLGIAGYLLWEVLNGPAATVEWIHTNAHFIENIQAGGEGSTWRTLLMAFFTSTLAMPHMFHLAFTENRSAESLHKASWGMPLYLLLLALCVPIIVFAGYELGIMESSSLLLFNIGYLMHQDWMIVLALMGGLSAASGIIIVAAISLASMLQNHVILPFADTPENIRFYSWLLWLRRALILAVIFASFLFYTKVGVHLEPKLLGLSAFVAFLQFLPGLIAILFWLGATRLGFISGLLAGMVSWMITTFYPAALKDVGIDELNWESSAIFALVINTLLFVVISRISKPHPDEARAAESCLLNTMDSPREIQRPSFTPNDVIHILTPKLGEGAARRELHHALQRLGVDREHLAPLDLLRLRNTLEQNLSALIGPVEAATILEPLSKSSSEKSFQARDIHLLETHLETYQARLSGLAVELDELRRYHRTTLEKLPIGAFTIAPSQHILFWNNEMAKLTGLAPHATTDRALSDLPAPWNELLPSFTEEEDNHTTEREVIVEGHSYWLTLHKSPLSDSPDSSIVVLVEDGTEQHLLTDRLAHSERLSSIGRFAAGVAHEIGNPVTGIACLAQNLSLETDDPEILHTGDEIIEQTKRISRIVQSLVRFAHTGQTINDVQFERFSLNDAIDEAVHLVSLDSHARDQQFIKLLGGELEIDGDPQLILQVLVNVLNNACDASPAKSTIWIRAESQDQRVKLSITDEGAGIPAEAKNKIFEPFFTTKEPGKGTGLGLPLVYNILTEHYGSIELISPANKKQNKGTQVLITLPGSRPETGRVLESR